MKNIDIQSVYGKYLAGHALPLFVVIFFGVSLMFDPANAATAVGNQKNEFLELMEQHGYTLRTTELGKGEDHRDIRPGREGSSDPNLSRGQNNGTVAGSCLEDCNKRGENPAGFGMQDIAVIGTHDSRQDPEAFIRPGSADERQYMGVGYIRCTNTDGDRYYGTGTLVGPTRNIVLTAAHNFYGDVPSDLGIHNDGSQVCDLPSPSQRDEDVFKMTDLSTCEFIVLNQRKEVIFRSGLETIEVGSKRPAHSKETGKDWAVVRLKQTAPRSFATLGVSRLSDEDLSQPLPATNVAYHGDMADSWVRYKTENYIIPKDRRNNFYCDPNVLAHHFDTSNRASGSPIIIDNKVVAIHVAGHGSWRAGQPGDAVSNQNLAVRINAEILRAYHSLVNRQ